MTRLLILPLSLFFYGFGPVERCTIPKAHERFEGEVIQVWDGDTIYVRTAACSSLHVRLIDLSAPEKNEAGGQFAKDVMTRLALGQNVRCEVTKGRFGGYQSYGRPHAVCRVHGESLGTMARAAGVTPGGRGFRP